MGVLKVFIRFIGSNHFIGSIKVKEQAYKEYKILLDILHFQKDIQLIYCALYALYRDLYLQIVQVRLVRSSSIGRRLPFFVLPPFHFNKLIQNIRDVTGTTGGWY